MEYTLEFLSEEFARHMKEYEGSPHYAEKEFNLSKALKMIVDTMIEAQSESTPISVVPTTDG